MDLRSYILSDWRKCGDVPFEDGAYSVRVIRDGARLVLATVTDARGVEHLAAYPKKEQLSTPEAIALLAHCLEVVDIPATSLAPIGADGRGVCDFLRDGEEETSLDDGRYTVWRTGLSENGKIAYAKAYDARSGTTHEAVYDLDRDTPTEEAIATAALMDGSIKLHRLQDSDKYEFRYAKRRRDLFTPLCDVPWPPR